MWLLQAPVQPMIQVALWFIAGVVAFVLLFPLLVYLVACLALAAQWLDNRFNAGLDGIISLFTRSPKLDEAGKPSQENPKAE